MHQKTTPANNNWLDDIDEIKFLATTQNSPTIYSPSPSYSHNHSLPFPNFTQSLFSLNSSSPLPFNKNSKAPNLQIDQHLFLRNDVPVNLQQQSSQSSLNSSTMTSPEEFLTEIEQDYENPDYFYNCKQPQYPSLPFQNTALLSDQLNQVQIPSAASFNLSTANVLHSVTPLPIIPLSSNYALPSDNLDFNLLKNYGCKVFDCQETFSDVKDFEFHMAKHKSIANSALLKLDLDCLRLNSSPTLKKEKKNSTLLKSKILSPIQNYKINADGTNFSCTSPVKSKPPGETVCKLENCNKVFKRTADLRRHQKSLHLKTTCFTCDLCNKNFNRNDTFKKHLKVGPCMGAGR
ncbi:hypothetical protein HK099_007559 [Clydaea vesicula]|uniref:C2H2-type domain-containing protein n=1 Tax=Clydaea vesicula TaxID=447962 RepID=A0AAD5XTK6_9FUNG|nr:hypothetical protein HK099_007559 [Clydaea vesicula]KAJ3394685.1 hypothetical protein HDU92_006674 [Lobulomyces angularis]